MHKVDPRRCWDNFSCSAPAPIPIIPPRKNYFAAPDADRLTIERNVVAYLCRHFTEEVRQMRPDRHPTSYKPEYRNLGPNYCPLATTSEGLATFFEVMRPHRMPWRAEDRYRRTAFPPDAQACVFRPCNRRRRCRVLLRHWPRSRMTMLYALSGDQSFAIQSFRAAFAVASRQSRKGRFT